MSKKEKMVVCRNCNAPIAKKAKICSSCGAKNKKPFYKRGWFILIIFLLAVGAISSIGRNKKEKFDWSEVELCDRLPKPKSNVGEIWSNHSDYLSIQVEKTSKSEYKGYVKECQSMGYTIESEDTGESYEAFDEEGYGLSLRYSDESMNIKLEAPIEMGALHWPKSEIASLLPIPKSNIGNISTDTAEGCYIYVGDTSKDDFNTYADECSESGFSVDYERGDTFYHAKDQIGNQLSLSYQGNNVMAIHITKSTEAEVEDTDTEPDVDVATSPESNQKEPEEKPSADTQLVDGMRPEFKKAMDSYEAFMNEYCDFMKKYTESAGADLGLLADYTDYMSKYADVVEDFEAWDNGEMNTAEIEYYWEVQTRVEKKLLELAE